MSSAEIDIKVDRALERFKEEVLGSEAFVKKAEGASVLSEVVKAGFLVGGEYREAALRANNYGAQYYKAVSASIGFQIGAQ